MARASLPPGFRFHPTDVELILYYLKRKVLGKRLVIDAITDLDLCKFSPWDLPDKSCLRSRDLEWYFFCPKDKKYAQGVRTNRATEIGYWKTTGRDRPICNETHTVGMKKTLIFHLGRAPLGKRTNWVMHEYRLEIKDLTDAGILQDSYVLCKIFEKSGAGPKNGEQHGAPFKEEEWEDNLVENSLAPLPLVDSSFPSIFLDDKKNIVSEDSTFSLEKTCESSFQHPCQDVSSDTSRENQFMLDNVDMDYIFTLLEAENDPRLIGNDSIKMSESNYRSNIEAPPPSNGNDIFGDLEDHKTMTKLNGTDHLDLTKMSDGNVLGQTLLMNGMAYVELDDFDSPMKYPVNGDGPNHIQYENSRSKLEIGTGDKLTLSSEDVCSIRLSDLDIPEKYSWKPVNGDGPKHIQYENSRSKLEIGTEDKLALSSENVCSIRSSDFDVPEKYPCEVTSETFFSGHQFSCNSDVSLEGFSPMETVHLHPVSGTGLSACIVHKDSSAPLFNLDVASSAATSGVGSSRCVLHKDSGAVDCLDVASNDHSGFEGTSVSWYEDPKQTPEIHLGGRLNTNTQRTSSRGEHHSGNSRLHRLLGSIPAPAASAAEFPLSINAGKGSKGNSLFTNHGGSSIHVKAEVSVRCGCTEEALSGKLGEFPYLCCCGLQFPRKELKKVATACSSGFTFVFLLGVVTALVWLLIFTIVVKVGWSAWKLIISELSLKE